MPIVWDDTHTTFPNQRDLLDMKLMLQALMNLKAILCGFNIGYTYHAVIRNDSALVKSSLSAFRVQDICFFFLSTAVFFLWRLAFLKRIDWGV